MSAELALPQAVERIEASSLLDVVRRAVNSENVGVGEGKETCSAALDPVWFAEEAEKPVVAWREKSAKAGGVYTDDLILRRNVGKCDETVVLRQQKEDALVLDLTSSLAQPGNLSEEVFRFKLRPFLEFLVSGGVEDLERKEGKNHAFNGEGMDCDGEEGDFLDFFRRSSTRLGGRMVRLIIQCCTAIRYWRPVQVLLKCDVVSGHFCCELVQELVEVGNPFLLCLCVRHVVDLRPFDTLSMLRYVLSGATGSFAEVRLEWNDAAASAISSAAKKHKRVTSGKELEHKGERIPGVEQPSRKASFCGRRGKALMSALVMAMAVDGFSPAELWLHHLVASEQDEAVLASVIGMLDTEEILKVFRYLSKWVDKYLGRLAHVPFPKGTRSCNVPSVAQILLWTSIVLDVHYARFALGSELSDELRALQGSVRYMVALCSEISPLVGIAEHLRSTVFVPTKNQSADYFVEYIDV